jgi:hypothetical protein
MNREDLLRQKYLEGLGATTSQRPSAQTESLSPEEELLLAIIRSAVKEKDHAYFESQTFEMHCHLLRTDPDIVRAGIKRSLAEES